MKRRQQVALTVMVTCAVGVGVLPATAHAGSNQPKATEIGVTAKEIHIVTIADVDNALAPGVFEGAVLGAKGAAKYLNSKAGGGGIAGRKVVVDFIDSKLSATESRNAVITACSQDFAMVGGAQLFLSNVDDEVNCVDKTGAATGLPDMASFATGVPQSCSPVSFPANPPQLVCSTKDQAPQTYNSANGQAKYLLKKFGKLHGLFPYASDTKDAERGSRVLDDAIIAAGIKADQYVALSARSLQSAYTPLVNTMKTDNSNFAVINGNANSMVSLRSEASVQGVSPDVVWLCGGCYSQSAATNSVLEGTWVNLGFLPFEEASSNPTLKAFLKYVPRDKADSFAIYSWVATLAFADAVKAVVAKDGVNGLTRKAFLADGVPTLTKFDAGGMVGVTNIADKIPSGCYVMMQIEKGKYVRRYPTKKGTLDCSPSNKVQIKEDYVGG